VGQEETPTNTPTDTPELVTNTPSATATTDDTGGEEETPGTSPTPADATATATQGVSDLPDTGAEPNGEEGVGLLGAILVAAALAGIGFTLRRRTASTDR